MESQAVLILLHTKSNTPQNHRYKKYEFTVVSKLAKWFSNFSLSEIQKFHKYVAFDIFLSLKHTKRGAKPLYNIMSHSMPQSAKTTEAARVAASSVSIKSSAQAHS